MLTQYQDAALGHSLGKIGCASPLARLVKVSEDQVAAENQVEDPRRQPIAQILLQELDRISELAPQAVDFVVGVESRAAPFEREIFQAARAVAASGGPSQALRIAVRAEDFQVHVGEALAHLKMPDEPEREGLLTTAAAEAQAIERFLSGLLEVSAKCWEHFGPEVIEDPSVTVESADRDAAESVQLPPFFCVLL